MSRKAVLKVLASGQVDPSPCWPRARCPLCGRSSPAVRHTRRGLHWAWSVRRPWTGQSGWYVHTQRLASISSSLSVLWVPLSWWYLSCLGVPSFRPLGQTVSGTSRDWVCAAVLSPSSLQCQSPQILWICTIVRYNECVRSSNTMTLYHCQIQWMCTIVKYNDFVSLSSRMNLYNIMNLYCCQVQ